MKVNQLPSVKYLKKIEFWLLAIASVVTTIYLTLIWRFGDIAQLGMSLLFLLAVVSLVWEKRQSLSFESSVLVRALGSLLLVGMLLISTFLTSEHILRLTPFVCALGLSLLASGFKGLKQYWRELLILFFLGVPSVLLSSPLTDISLITAQFSTFILWYLGFSVSRQATYIILPKGSIEVYYGCSGMEAMTYLLGLAVIFLTMFPTNRSQKIFVPIVAVTIGFVVNAIRVAFMAVLVATSHPGAFQYWHEGEGSLIFGMIAVLLFGSFCLFLLRQQEQKASLEKS